MTPDNTFLLIGLGNPGREYRDTRHNVGFMLIDRLAVRLDARGMKVQSKAIITTATYLERKLILAKPQTYMNLSGHSAQGLLNFYKIPIENMLIAHDDLDIPFGTTTSYGAIAKKVGSPNAARAVGAANGANPIALIVPCHRVIGADGSLTGYGGGLPLKRKLLEHEARVCGTRLDLFG